MTCKKKKKKNFANIAIDCGITKKKEKGCLFTTFLSEPLMKMSNEIFYFCYIHG